MKITIETIPHDQQRYQTVGDWRLVDGVLAIRVSSMRNWRYEMAVATHELVEALLCIHKGVTASEVDEFDMSYVGAGEPGDDTDAPYRDQHCFATAVERMLIAAMEQSWADYEKAVEALA